MKNAPHDHYNGRGTQRGWLPLSRWKLVQQSVPIVCVDLMPIRICSNGGDEIEEVGLIFRDTPHQGRRWCLVGGRLLYGESVHQAICRQVRETLGRGVKVHLRENQQPIYIAQYSPHPKQPFALDPRQHAVGLTFAARISGVPAAAGEALRYQWFPVGKLPARSEFGFGHDRLVRTCLRRLRLSAAQFGAR